jgi:hypothetical protein
MAFFPVLTVASSRCILRIQPKRTYSIIMWTLFDFPSTVNSGMTVQSEGYITEETMFDNPRKYHMRIQFY